MTFPSDIVGQPSVKAGRATWRAAVASEADRLSAQLEAAVAAAGPAADASAAGSAATVARSAIERARSIATGKAERRLRDWWFGTSIESAWQALHLASEQLVLVEPDAAQPDPRVARRILNAHHDQSDSQHQQIRRLRNLLYVLLAVVAAIDCALWATNVTTGSVVGLGALAGALSVVFALRAGTPPGPYNVLPAQSLLKVASGAATALMAVKILDYISGVSGSTLRDSMYAVVFGFSQQAFTRLVDQQAGALAQGPNARVGAAGSPLPSSGAAAPPLPGE